MKRSSFSLRDFGMAFVPLGILQLKENPRIEHVDDERGIGNGIIITLRQGWTFDQLCDNRVRGADTIAEAKEMVRYAHPFGGPFDE
jgi:hypothetical protein